MGRLREKQWFITEDKYGFYLRWVKHDVVCLECSIISLIYSYYYNSENFLQARIFFEQLNFERVVESVSYKVDMI